MLRDDKRIRVIVGHYGSGKTEVSVNYAMTLREELTQLGLSEKIAIADIDTVNPYFRSREKEELLQGMGIESYSSILKNSALDLPAVSPEILYKINDTSCNYIIDVGGDVIGTKVLGSISTDIQKQPYDMFMVINKNREFTDTAEKIIEYIKDIEQTSKLKMTGIINNTHMLWDTETKDILDGSKLANEVGDILGIPVKYTTCWENIEMDKKTSSIKEDILKIRMIMREDWM